MQSRSLGATGVRVPALGLGAGRIGGAEIAEVDRLVSAALDLGVTLSEELLGGVLQGRREQVILSTKVGYGVPHLPDWIVHLHSCPLATLQRGGVIEALQAAVRAGKVRVAA